MFDKLKQAKQLLELQSQLKKEKVVSEKQGVKVVLNGKLEVEDVVLNPELDISKQAQVIKDCFNDAVRKMQVELAKKMSNLPGLGL